MPMKVTCQYMTLRDGLYHAPIFPVRLLPITLKHLILKRVSLKTGDGTEVMSSSLGLLSGRVTPVAVTSHIIVEANDATQFVKVDETLSALKRKKGDDAVIRVVTKDAQGNVVPNVPFIIKREGYRQIARPYSCRTELSL